MTDVRVKKCEGCGKETDYQPVEFDNGEWYWECVNCGYRVDNRMQLKEVGE